MTDHNHLVEEINEKLDRNVLWRLRTERWCFDCGEDEGPSYMVTDGVWYEAMPEYKVAKARANDHEDAHVCLCLSCLQKRLGRNLELEDFTNAPINAKLFIGATIAFNHAAREVPEGSFRDAMNRLWAQTIVRIKGRE